MRFVFLIPGTGGFFCGSCLRDDWLVRALRRRGHDVTVVPLYLPLHREEIDGTDAPVHLGGINVYLQEKLPFTRWLPNSLARWLNRPALLRFVARRSRMTSPRDLGDLTLSMIRGSEGRQRHELAKLVKWLERQPKPDAIVLSNALLAGAARSLTGRLGVPVFVTLQGEAPFLDALPDSHRERAWEALRESIRASTAVIAVSEHYGDILTERLSLPSSRVHVVRNGLELTDWPEVVPRLSEREPPTIGYLARLCRDKGLPTLVRAFELLAERNRVPGVRLMLAGVQLREDLPLIEELLGGLDRRGLSSRVSTHPNIDRRTKMELLRSFSVLSVPATYGESFGLYLLEAWAAGVPVVQPQHGAFPELIAITGGGVLCEPDDPASLADALENLLLDPQRAQSLADAGRRGVRERFTADRMATEFEAVVTMPRTAN